MVEERRPTGVEARFGLTVHLMVRVAALVLLLGWCLAILRPFLTPILWGVIIAISSHKAFVTLSRALGGRTMLAAAIYVLAGLALLVVPAGLLASTLFTSLKALAFHLADGTFRLPPPPQVVRSWILIGDPLHRFWALASANLDEALKVVAPELTKVGRWLFSLVGQVMVGFAEFIIAICVAAALLMNAAGGQRIAGEVATRLAGADGRTHSDLAVRTIRSVTRGIIGVALIQATLAGLGFLAAGIPAAGLLALVCLIVSIVQLPLLLVLLPVVIYAFTDLPVLPASLFAAWCLMVALLEHVLKPLLLGRGVEVPMLVVFIGAIGGLLSSGMLGLFVGPVVLALGYTLVLAWLHAASGLDEKRRD
ncbi:AI-2E family transporter [Xanthobacter dioxanivorans]|uniref:AI-2E family transporter n=1 Tax=Xanthobacter dioxanivorans TaxID=2528964 RepID=A0A974PLK6_9HYPH|nr:AI-2E family transporter [Xanthobacter dioxanivorans]QRG05511.1 AI-2E family transporter [Xanthobacter dioxanivorans]